MKLFMISNIQILSLTSL